MDRERERGVCERMSRPDLSRSRACLRTLRAHYTGRAWGCLDPASTSHL